MDTFTKGFLAAFLLFILANIAFTNSAHAASQMGFLQSQYVSGPYKNCIYSNPWTGGTITISIKSYAQCRQSIRVPSPY